MSLLESFIKIGQLVEKLLGWARHGWMDTQTWYHKTSFPYFFKNLSTSERYWYIACCL